MARKDQERRYRLQVMRWRAVILTLQIIRLVLRIELVVLLIILAMLPISPYVLIGHDGIGECRYVGARGLWEPGRSSPCVRVALRQHFFIDY